MKALVIYDSMYGNTAKIAQAIGDGLRECGEVKVIKVTDATTGQLKDADLIVVGSPTQKFRPLPATTAWLKGIVLGSLDDKRAAVFDTRLTRQAVAAVKILSFFVWIFGYAAGTMEKQLKKSGAKMVVAGEGFYIKDTQGPLVEGEIDRARAWGKKLAG